MARAEVLMDPVISAVVEILKGLSSPDDRTRASAADSVVDVMASLDDFGAVVASALAMARLSEESESAQEAELHALAELCEWDLVPDAVRRLVLAAVREGDDPAQDEYLQYLRDPRGQGAS